MATVAVTEPLFVPKHRVLPLGAIFSGKVPGLEVPGNTQARFGYPTFVPSRGLAISPWETGPLAQPRTLF